MSLRVTSPAENKVVSGNLQKVLGPNYDVKESNSQGHTYYQVFEGDKALTHDQVLSVLSDRIKTLETSLKAANVKENRETLAYATVIKRLYTASKENPEPAKITSGLKSLFSRGVAPTSKDVSVEDKPSIDPNNPYGLILAKVKEMGGTPLEASTRLVNGLDRAIRRGFDLNSEEGKWAKENIVDKFGLYEAENILAKLKDLINPDKKFKIGALLSPILLSDDKSKLKNSKEAFNIAVKEGEDKLKKTTTEMKFGDKKMAFEGVNRLLFEGAPPLGLGSARAILEALNGYKKGDDDYQVTEQAFNRYIELQLTELASK